MKKGSLWASFSALFWMVCSRCMWLSEMVIQAGRSIQTVGCKVTDQDSVAGADIW